MRVAESNLANKSQEIRPLETMADSEDHDDHDDHDDFENEDVDDGSDIDSFSNHQRMPAQHPATRTCFQLMGKSSSCPASSPSIIDLYVHRINERRAALSGSEPSLSTQCRLDAEGKADAHRFDV